MSRMTARQCLISTWRWALETFGEFVASRPALIRRLAINAFVLMAGLFIMLARTSPALAADNSHGQGKSQDRTSAAAVAQRHDSPGHTTDQEIGGSGGGDGNNGKSKPKTGGTGNGGASAAPAAKSSGEGGTGDHAAVTAKSDTHASGQANATAKDKGEAKGSGQAK